MEFIMGQFSLRSTNDNTVCKPNILSNLYNATHALVCLRVRQKRNFSFDHNLITGAAVMQNECKKVLLTDSPFVIHKKVACYAVTHPIKINEENSFLMVHSNFCLNLCSYIKLDKIMYMIVL